MSLLKRAILFLIFILPAYGYCCTYSFIGSPYTINYGNIVAQRDAQVGQAISNAISGTYATGYVCRTSGNEGSSAGLSSFILSYAFTSTSGARVYNTNVPGVGISIGYYTNETAAAASASGTYYINDSTNTSVSLWTSNPGDTDTYRFQPMIQFWKTGNITSGSLSGQIAAFFGRTARTGGSSVADIPIYAGSGSITQVACSITTPNLTFPIGDILASNFGSSVGTTPSVAQNTQNLGLNCDAQANINVSLSGTQNPDVSNTSVLALTNQGGANVAKGVGVQIIYNGTPLVLNSNIVLKRSSGGQETFPLTARYYQTKTAVGTGTANASATLNLTYQ
ncbi:fimbrial protein [Buttiauxella sp. WJP83]|uniref:fimbrial protein n=1 Tax=Buttiauxella sp. WJP83 TaxID=2986951 RepID=UPI0022DD2173|nr:fimbrial protein [Buttiauxella sp. WJP83]WBM72579.1 fimbrial protein [Buttiauxella sp. WJP83]